MERYMFFVCTNLSESLWTEMTLKGFICIMGALVNLQINLLTKSLVAYVTLK